jgi:hypothetical protein
VGPQRRVTHARGISASEVLDGAVPGGIDTLFVVWAALAILSAVARVRYRRPG